MTMERLLVLVLGLATAVSCSVAGAFLPSISLSYEYRLKREQPLKYAIENDEFFIFKDIEPIIVPPGAGHSFWLHLDFNPDDWFKTTAIPIPPDLHPPNPRPTKWGEGRVRGALQTRLLLLAEQAFLESRWPSDG